VLPAYASSMIPEFLCEIGIKFYNQGRYEDALHEFKKALIVTPDYETALKYIGNNNNSVSTLTVFESEGIIHFVRFFFNGTSLFLTVSRKAMTEKNVNILSMYEKVLALARQLDLSSGSKL